MTFLGMDIDQTHHAVQTLRIAGRQLPRIVDQVAQGEQVSLMATSVRPLLHQIEADLALASELVERAAWHLVSFRMQPPVTKIDSPAWNGVYQDASHNSYVVSGGVAHLFERGVRAFELDIHRGPPTNFSSFFGHRFGILGDHFDHRGGRDGDWMVYHHSADTESQYWSLRQGLQAIVALDSHEPITVFIDNKDRFGGAQSVRDFDALLVEVLGARLFMPEDIRARSQNSDTLAQAVQSAGWPTANDLAGRIIVVLTDEIDGYRAEGQIAFIAPRPIIGEDQHGHAVHLVDPAAVFYNAHTAAIGPVEISAIQASASVLRVYGEPACDVAFFGPDTLALEPQPNYRAIDHEPDPPECAGPQPIPPQGVPVPVGGSS